MALIQKLSLLHFIPALALLSASCTANTPTDRRIRDESVGIAETENYRFEADEGLLHILEATPARITAMATSQEFTFRVTRKDPATPSLELVIANVPASLQLNAPAGTLNAGGTPATGSAATALRLGRQWTLNFATPGSDTVSVSSVALPQQPFEFLTFGDIQDARPEFGDMVEAMKKEASAEFILILGDLASRTRPEEYDELETHFRNLPVPLYLTPGNHDVFRADEFQNRYGRVNYTMTHRGARFTSLDSASAEIDTQAFEWLNSWMDRGANQLHIIYSHIPAREYLSVRSGQWNSPAAARDFVARSADAGVNLFLFGHVHTYERYSLAGIPTYISGGGGAIPMRFDGVGRHYLKISADPQTQSLRVERIGID